MPTKTIQRQPRNKVTYVARALPEEGFVRLITVLAVLGISKTSFLNGIKEGKYPGGKLLSPRCRVWEVSAIRGLLASIEQKKA
jgi:prophage regulatory protein